MQPEQLLSVLRRTMSPVDAGIVLSALKSDDLIWETFQSPANVQAILTEEKRTLPDWTPANLALTLLSCRNQAESLQSDNLPGIDTIVRRKALQIFETILRNGKPVQSLAEAGLVALALRERRRKTQTWQGVYEELTAVAVQGDHNIENLWMTPLACVFGMIPDQGDFLQALLKVNEPGTGTRWISHILLCQPLPSEQQFGFFRTLLESLTLNMQIDWLRSLYGGKPSMVRRLSAHLLLTGDDFLVDLKDDFNPDHASWTQLSEKALGYESVATLHQMAGHPAQAGMYLEKARTILHHWLTGSTYQMASIASQDGSISDDMWDECAAIGGVLPVSEKLLSEALFLSSEKVSPLMLNELQNSRIPLLARVFIANLRSQTTGRREAQEVAREAIQYWLRQVKNDPNLLNGQFIFDYKPWPLLNVLTDLSLYQEAIEVSSIFLRMHQDDTQLMMWTSNIAHRLENDDLALDLINQVILLQPEDVQPYRILAGYLEDRGEWTEALEERRNILNLVPLPAIEDRLQLAHCALGGENFAEAEQVCQKILIFDPDQGLAFSYLGLACEGLGEVEEAISHLSKATLLIPENSLPWVHLARLHRKNGDPQRSLETLRSAILNAPDSADLHFELGKACLETGLVTEALPFLRQSARLAPESDEVALALTQTLLSLSHEAEALEVIEKARNRWPAHPGLAYQHARLLIEKDDLDEGMAVLEVALQSEQPEAEWFIYHARVLSGDLIGFILSDTRTPDFNQVIRAQKSLQRALALDAKNFEARLLLAEVRVVRKEYELAYAAYQQIVDLDQATSPAWLWRIQAGFGSAALLLGKTDMAITSLQNAVSANLKVLDLQRMMTLAYCRGNLTELAARSAETALSLAPDHVDNLVWYGDTMDRIGIYDKAIEALQTACQISPLRIDLVILLAELYVKVADFDLARFELARTVSFDNVSSGDLRTVAYTAMAIHDIELAQTALEKAIDLSTEVSAELYYELGIIYQKQGCLEEALEAVQTAISNNPNQVDMYVIQSDLQESLDRPQAAMASLERALRITEGKAARISLAENGRKDDRPDWLKVDDSIFTIHKRYALLHYRINDFNLAFYHAEKALEQCPQSAEIRYLVAELACRLLQTEQIDAIASQAESQLDGGCFTSYSSGEEAKWLGGLLALQAEKALDEGDYQKGSHFIEQGLAHDPQHLRLKIAQVRVLTHRGEFTEGKQLFDQVCSELLPGMHQRELDEQLSSIPLNNLHWALAEAAVDLYDWRIGMTLFDHYARQFNTEPLALISYARALVRATEWQVSAAPKQLQAHVYPEDLTTKPVHEKLSTIFYDFSRLCHSQEIVRWKARTEAVFYPSAASVRELASISIQNEDAASLVMALRRIGNPSGACQVGEQFKQNARVQVQIADALVDMDLDKAFEAARQAVALAPRNPLCQVTLAQLAETKGDFSQALEALQVALQRWNDEPAWHLWAARLADQCEEPEAAQYHLELAHQLLPDDFEVMLTLSASYQRFRLYEKSVEILEKAVKCKPGDVRVWMFLAGSLTKLEQYNDALRAVRKAIEINPEGLDGYVLAGEIVLQLGDEARALEYVREAQRIEPADANTRLLAARIMIKKGRQKDALAELNRAVEDIPDALELCLERARLIYQLQGPKEALATLQNLAVDHPEDDRVLALLSHTYTDIGSITGAEKAANQSLKLNSFQPDLHLLLGRLYQANGQLDKAIFHLSESARMNPADITAYLEIGKVYTVRREFSQALEAYQRAIHVAPDEYQPYYQAALVLRDGKDYPGAETMLRRAAQLAPEDVNIRRQLGAIVALNLVHTCQEANSCL